MSIGILSSILLALAAAGYFIGRARAVSAAGGDTRKLHSLAGFYGQSVALFTAVPAFLLMAAWLFIQPILIESRVSGQLQQTLAPDASLSLVMADVRRLANAIDSIGTADEVAALSPEALTARLGEQGVAMGGDMSVAQVAAANEYRLLSNQSRTGMTVATIALALAGLAFALRRIRIDFRARNVTEQFVMVLMIAASLIAVLTTAGIVVSLLFETIHFFKLYPASDFFLSTTWSPKFGGGSDLGIWPLLWGTLYVSLIALIVAVPVGLMSAIYLAEYASPRVRTWVKPAIEILAGIPTIVYGLFALITVGPLLRDYFALPLGLGNSSSSVMTAGLVMGIMVIPFVSSLSDDIINAVPQSLRDGSLGLGATPSETVRQVVLPAALPGIVGAILLAASRAIGETMIVVMGAGAAAKLSLNPFEAMTTVTVKIVSQLTGDTEFASPETLVAFALGLTLFVITLALNILALWIVRRYREQYE